MDKILDLLLKTPAAKRIVKALVNRALVAGIGALLAWLKLDPDAASLLSADLHEVAETIGPWLAAAIVGWMAIRKAKKTELTIEVARQSPEGMPRDIVDHTVRTLLKEGQAGDVLKPDTGTRYQGPATQWGPQRNAPRPPDHHDY